MHRKLPSAPRLNMKDLVSWQSPAVSTLLSARGSIAGKGRVRKYFADEGL